MKPSRQAQRIPAQRRGRRRAGPSPGARRMACAALLSCAAMLAACGGGGGSSPTPPGPGPGPTPPETMPTPPNAVSWTGPGAVTMDGSTLTAVPYADGAFEEWKGEPCDGSTAPACMRPDSGSGYPVAVFRPFVAAGIKSLAFGLGYQGESPHSFQVSLRRGTDAVYELPPALEGLPGSGQASVSLTVPVHLLPWGRGGYLTEACDASSTCVAPPAGATQSLAQAVSHAVTGYFKAPVADAGDVFGTFVALSADGSTLAVGAPHEDSASTGTFVPNDEPGSDYQPALESDDVNASGAVTVYRRTGAAWSVEAFVKAPVADDSDKFGSSVALSADGSTLAVGTPLEDSASTGTFVPNDEPGSDYQLALESDGADASGAAYVYRRSRAGQWAIEAFVKAPRAGGAASAGGAGDTFTSGEGDGPRRSLALSADGGTLAVGAPGEDSASTGTFFPGGEGYEAALDSNSASNSGAVTVYRRHLDQDNVWMWDIEAFVKAPVADAGDDFGYALALSGDGATLAVGAPGDGSASTGTFVPSDDPESPYRRALASNSLDSFFKGGAVTVYRRSDAGRWAIEAFVKAPFAATNDDFSHALALSADGATLAVSAPFEDGLLPGVYVPGGEDYQEALDSHSGGSFDSGAVTVYRRRLNQDNVWVWDIKAFVRAPNPGKEYHFGISLDLSSNGVVMAVGSSGEDSSFSGVFVPDGDDYQDALDSVALDTTTTDNMNTNQHGGAGAAYVYRRSDAGRWALEAFVKPPNPEARDDFGTDVKLSGDGDTLAVGAPFEDGAALPQPVNGGSADAGNAVGASGAVYLY